MDDDRFYAGVLTGVLLVAVIILLTAACANRFEWTPNENTCALAGYSEWEPVGPLDNGLCLGVIDGEWKAEPLDDVRARLGER